VTAIGDEDLRLLANCLNGDRRLLDEVFAQCVTGAPCADPTAAAVAKFISSKVPSEAVDSVLHELRGALAVSVPISEPTQLCLTMPLWLRSASFASIVASTEVAMINVILHARSSLKLAFPFIDAASRDVFKQLEYAWLRGCSLQILCRETGNVKAMGLRDDFVVALLESKAGASCKVPTYVDNVKWTFHAKVLIADDVSAYVGSANLTKASLSDQAEVGILISEPVVIKDLRTWFSSLWSALVLAG
jgi:phosphatidylserine/phosphatidylglycerophosphate/cardiolipin synthase-like enzyme